MAITILDCYTDEPAGLGVPPYLGTYPRYMYGYLKEQGNDIVYYLTIDDIRLFKKYRDIRLLQQYNSTRLFKQCKVLKNKQKTDIKVYNPTSNYENISKILSETDELDIILGVHTPGKYLSAVPGTLNEVIYLLSDIKCTKILTGPVIYGTSSEGGRFFEKADLSRFGDIKRFDFSYKEIAKYAVEGSRLISQIPDLRIIEIETGRGCSRARGCSFCTEPIKHKPEFRERRDIIDEIKSFYVLGMRDFRIGKQSCFYSYPDAVRLLEEIKRDMPDLRTLHIDNVNPVSVLSERGKKITEAVVKNCTAGNVAAFGVESFDADVFSGNNLNCDAESCYDAVRVINEYGDEVGENGMQKFLPGINILFGLNNETRKTHEENMKWLRKILDDGFLLRRINIRQVNIFEGTPLFESVGNRYLKRNKRFYWKWRNDIRQKIDFPMLKKLVPQGRVLKGVRAEVYDGNHTFARQIGSYPLIVGINKRIELKRFYDVKVTGHMLRSVVGEVL